VWGWGHWVAYLLAGIGVGLRSIWSCPLVVGELGGGGLGIEEREASPHLSTWVPLASMCHGPVPASVRG
jgi:hypothetical protein